MGAGNDISDHQAILRGPYSTISTWGMIHFVSTSQCKGMTVGTYKYCPDIWNLMEYGRAEIQICLLVAGTFRKELNRSSLKESNGIESYNPFCHI